MGLFDYVAPSERVAELVLVARRLRRLKGLDVVPMLVVEGRTDEPAWGSLCLLGEDQVFSAGTRGLVEQMAVFIEANPIEGCHCAYVVDCDTSGKAAHLKHRQDLVVTQTCDIESDLVKIGIAARVIRPFLDGEEAAHAAVAAAVRFALPLSVVRRAAHHARISMKIQTRQLRLSDLPAEIQHAWEQQPPTDQVVVGLIAERLAWSPEQRRAVIDALGDIDRAPDRCLMGKDILDALFRIVRRDGHGEIRGWSVDFFHRTVLSAIQREHVESWIVVDRLRGWAAQCGCSLFA